MKHLQKTILLISIIFLSSCEKKLSELEYEKNVMTQIFPSLIDSTCVDTRIFSNPPPLYGEYITDKEGHVSVDTTKATDKQRYKLEEWKKNLAEIEKDTSKIIVAFEPLIRQSRERMDEGFEKHFSGKKISHSKLKDTLKYKLDFEKIKLNHKFKLKNISEFPKERDAIWNTKYSFVFSGIVYFTRIQFDKDKTCGILDAGFVCGRLCGQGFRIFIKKVNQNWVIDKIDGTWIS